MLRSLSKRIWGPSSGRAERQYQNFAVRFPWKGDSFRKVVASCQHSRDGRLLSPHGLVGYGDCSRKSEAFTYGVNWRSNSPHDHNIPCSSNVRFGFMVMDRHGGSTTTAGCGHYKGHSNAVFGYVSTFLCYVAFYALPEHEYPPKSCLQLPCCH